MKIKSKSYEIFQQSETNYFGLIWILAKTDFKMRYHGSVLGYVWALLKPLLIFLILNFVFSNIFRRGEGIENYPLQLITGIIIWTYFSEGTNAGLVSLFSKANIISKVYFPRWVVVVSSTVHSTMVFMMNLIILLAFYLYYQVYPSLLEIGFFVFYIFCVYVLIISFSFIAGPLYLKFRDLMQIWSVILQALFYASPIIYPLNIIPSQYHKIMLLNPIGVLIHYSKVALIEDRLPTLVNHLAIIGVLVVAFLIGWLYFRSVSSKIIEYL
ncbi:MAG: hypothetical protein GF332_00045 [Candidatus Moranbacteria bacterium]|nr:hypothetical protein [Candidatus Moranbacteria bacterium]